MELVTIPVVVGPDRRLIIDLPPTTPLGPADVLIRPRMTERETAANDARTAVRERLLSAKFLSGEMHAPFEAAPLSDEDIAHLGQLTPEARPSEALIDEDRGAY